MKNKKIGGLLATTLLFGASTAFSGVTTTATDNKSIVEKRPDANPLSFLDGKLVFDVQERLRGESRNNNFDFNSGIKSPTDGNWLEQRFRLGMTVKPVSGVTIYAQAQDSREIGADRRPNPGVMGAEGNDLFDLRQAYVELSNGEPTGLSLKVGRQILSYGDERLVGAFDWNNIGRTFDAAKVRYQGDKWSVDAFVSSVVVPARGEFNESDVFENTKTHKNQVFSGVYYSDHHLDFQTTEVYAFGLDQENDPITTKTLTKVKTKAIPAAGGKKAVPAKTVTKTTFKTTPVTSSDFVTVGTRIKGDPHKLNGFEYDGEFAFQAGDVANKSLLAGAAHAGVGYNWFEACWKPRLYVEYNYASGSDTKGENGTFQNLFPTNHKFYGYMDLFSWQNLSEPAVWFTITPIKPLAVEFSYHAYWLATTQDAWYRANGVTQVRAITPAADPFVGTEFDVKATWTVCKNLSLEGGYSHFFAGDYLVATGAHSDADFGYLMATVKF